MSSKIKLKDITPSNIRNAIEGTTRYYTNSSQWIEEMVEYRASLCAQCTLAKKCLYCGCPAPQLYYATMKKDPKQRWPQIPNEEAWNTFKQTLPYQTWLKSRNSSTPS